MDNRISDTQCTEINMEMRQQDIYIPYSEVINRGKKVTN